MLSAKMVAILSRGRWVKRVPRTYSSQDETFIKIFHLSTRDHEYSQSHCFSNILNNIACIMHNTEINSYLQNNKSWSHKNGHSFAQIVG